MQTPEPSVPRVPGPHTRLGLPWPLRGARTGVCLTGPQTGQKHEGLERGPSGTCHSEARRLGPPSREPLTPSCPRPMWHGRHTPHSTVRLSLSPQWGLKGQHPQQEHGHRQPPHRGHDCVHAVPGSHLTVDTAVTTPPQQLPCLRGSSTLQGLCCVSPKQRHGRPRGPKLLPVEPAQHRELLPLSPPPPSAKAEKQSGSGIFR